MVLPAYIDESTGEITDGEAWVGLNTKTLGSDAAYVTFTSGYDDSAADVGGVQAWDQYMDLVVISYVRGTTASVNGNLTLRLNNDDTANIYPKQVFRGDGSSVYANVFTNDYADLGEMPGSSATANVFGVNVCDLFDINSGKYKSFLAQGGSGDHTDTNSYATLYSGTWLSQAAITEIDLTSRNLGNFVAGCKFSLYGILPRMVA